MENRGWEPKAPSTYIRTGTTMKTVFPLGEESDLWPWIIRSNPIDWWKSTRRSGSLIPFFKAVANKGRRQGRGVPRSEKAQSKTWKAESQLCLNPYFHRGKSPPIPFTSSGQMMKGFPAQMNSRKRSIPPCSWFTFTLVGHGKESRNVIRLRPILAKKKTLPLNQKPLRLPSWMETSYARRDVGINTESHLGLSSRITWHESSRL